MSTKVVSNPAKAIVSICAIEGKFTDVTYYMSTLKLSECKDQLDFAPTDEVATFTERVQRKLDKKRASELIFKKYLNKPGTRFFNSLVVVLMPKDGTEDGYYQFKPFKDEKGKSIGNVGMLEILSDIDRIVVDGQHRLHALKLADEQSRGPDYDRELGFSQIRVPVVFVTFEDIGGTFDETISDAELPRKVANKSRKLFVDLNKDVKKIDKNNLLVLDDSDLSAVAARSLIEDNESLEVYTKWSKTGSTLADADPYFTNILLLDLFAEIFFEEVMELDLEKIADAELELEDGRVKAIQNYFCSTSSELGLAPKNMIEDFFEKVSFFGKWKKSIREILGGDPKTQPMTTETTPQQRRSIRKLHQQQLLSTVVGQHAAFRAALDAFEHFDSEPKDDWHETLRRLSAVHDLGLFDRENLLWEELLVKAGKKLKLTAIRESSEVLSALIRLKASKSLTVVNVDRGVGTTETHKHYSIALRKLRKELK